MQSLRIPRTGVTLDEVAEVLRRELGPRYNVLAGAGRNWNPIGAPPTDKPDRILVGRGSNKLFRVEITISAEASETQVHIKPGGLTALPRLVNRLWLGGAVRTALRGATGGLHAREGLD